MKFSFLLCTAMQLSVFVDAKVASIFWLWVQQFLMRTSSRVFRSGCSSLFGKATAMHSMGDIPSISPINEGRTGSAYVLQNPTGNFLMSNLNS